MPFRIGESVTDTWWTSRNSEQLAAPFGIASSVYGYAYEDECDDNQQRSDDDFHGYSPLNDSMCRLIRRWSRKIPEVKATTAGGL